MLLPGLQPIGRSLQPNSISPNVFRNDEIAIEDIERYDVIMLSPGPGIPDEAGILKEVIATYAGRIPIFGVCLGLQAITEVFGGKIENMGEVFHGVATEMEITKKITNTYTKCNCQFCRQLKVECLFIK